MLMSAQPSRFELDLLSLKNASSSRSSCPPRPRFHFPTMSAHIPVFFMCVRYSHPFAHGLREVLHAMTSHRLFGMAEAKTFGILDVTLVSKKA